MKVKRAILAIVILFGVLGVFEPGADAAPAWYWCTINSTGLGWGNSTLNLTDTASSPAFVGRWFILNSTYQKEFLALVLTAMTNGSVVMIYVDPVEFSVIDAVYLQK